MGNSGVSLAGVFFILKAMQITVFGASGKVGRLVVGLAVARGYEVVAFVHSTNLFNDKKGVRVVRGDVHDPKCVMEAVEGSQAVISCLGSWHTRGKDILSAAMQAIIPAMERRGIKRIVTLTGAAAFDINDAPPLGQKAAHTLLSTFAGQIVQDGETHIRLLRASKLDWTVIRSPVMTGGAKTTYQLRTKLPGLFTLISRQTVATSLVDQIEVTESIRQAPIIYPAKLSSFA